ncbi:MAG: hypothetical protein R3F20_02500 [Planctomycetota bacterium]
MKRLLIALALVIFLGTAPASAQVTANVGPEFAPQGSDVLICVTNDTPSTYFIGSLGPIRVLDATGNEIYFFQAFTLVATPVPAGQAIVYHRWNQTDNFGNPVAPGAYFVEVTVNGVASTHLVAVGGDAPGIATVGVLRPGRTRQLYIASPLDPGAIYGYAAAFTGNTGILTCGGVIPLDVDALLTFSTTPGNGVFLNPVGALAGPADAFPGTTTLPAIAVPNDPMLSGFSFIVAAFTLDLGQPCPVSRISGPTTLTVL